MNNTFLKYLIIVPIIMLICSGCKQNNIIIETDFLTASEKQEAVKCKNGTILVKNNPKKSRRKDNFDNKIGKIQFEPDDLDFNH